MFFDFGDLSRRERHKLMTSTIVPRPIAWVSTVNAGGTINIGPFSFFNIVCEEPPLVSIGVGSGERFEGDLKDTGVNIRRTGEFVQGVVYSSTARAERLCRMVRKVHEPVVGTAPDGRPYAANDPELLDWVHIAE